MDVETNRLLVRLWLPSEAPRLLDILSRAEVVRWLGDGEPDLMKDVETAEVRIATYADRSAAPPLGFFAVEVKESGVVAGTVLLSKLPNATAAEVEIGWHLHPDSWGCGIASEAASALLAYGFEHGLSEIHAVTHLDNWPSQAVARKIGMTHLGRTDLWYDSPSEHFCARAGVWWHPEV